MNFKKFMATALTVAAVFTSLVVSASAAQYGPPPRGTEEIGKLTTVGWDWLGRPTYMKVGDANRNDKIDQGDATHILRYIMAMDKATWFQKNVTGVYVDGICYLAGFYYSEMDADRDGDVDQIDGTRILQYLLWNDL